MKSIGLPWTIHIFALLHAVVALICRAAGIDDQLFLTVLTMAMGLIICIKMGLKTEFTATVVIIVNILGFLIGTFGAKTLQALIQSEYLVHCLSTTITTEILGWCIIGITKVFGQKETTSFRSSPYLKWILLLASGIFLIRIFIVLFLSQTPLEHEGVFEMIRKFMTNSFSLIILVCVNILFIRTIGKRDRPSSKIGTVVLYAIFMILATLLEAFLVGLEEEKFMVIFTISMILQITIYCIVYMINYALTTRVEMLSEREKANMAQYRYLKLKRQVNPHFLFNSLNILDCLVCEEKTEQASTYIHKLAGIYRYMIKSEDEELVPLRDELTFVEQYVDLLKLRFPEGFEVEINAPDQMMSRYVLPCSIQLLIENATKHNAVTSDNPLRIRIDIDAKTVRVSNNIIPKVTRTESTGLGQKYIRQQYMDLSGKTIEIQNDGKTYCVTLPLL